MALLCAYSGLLSLDFLHMIGTKPHDSRPVDSLLVSRTEAVSNNYLPYC